MTSSSMVREEVERRLQSLVEQLRDGSLQSLMELQGRAGVGTPERPTREHLIESLESLVSLTLSAMLQFHAFTADLQRLVDRLANESSEQPADERSDRSRLN